MDNIQKLISHVQNYNKLPNEYRSLLEDSIKFNYQGYDGLINLFSDLDE